MSKIDLLELRIHGIANSPPAGMLCTTQEELEQKDGDGQGSFWQIAPTSGRKRPLVRGGTDVVEAYSWGNQARSGGSALALIGRAIVHVAWLFVLPFGLCNLAYWARRDIASQDEDRTWWAGGDGAVAIRVFALIQTLFYTVGFVTVFVHLVALQCFRAGEGDLPATTCAALPGWLDFLATWSPVARAALLSLFPIGIILLIYAISLRARRLFNPERSFDDALRPTRKPRSKKGPRAETGPAAGDSSEASSDPPRPPLLGTADFWQRSRVAQTTERAHLCAAIAFVLLLLAYDALLDAHPGVGPLELPFRSEVFTATLIQAAGVLLAGLLLLCALVVTVVAGLNGRVMSLRSKRGWSTALLVATSAVYLGWLAWALLVVRDPAAAAAFAGDNVQRGLVVAPTISAAAGALIAVGSLAWGLGWRRWPVYALIVLAVLTVGASELIAKNIEEDDPLVRAMLSIVVVLLVGGAIFIAYVPPWKPKVAGARQLSAWHGNGAAVALLLALFSSLVITSLLVLGAYSWLTADTDSPTVQDARRAVQPPAEVVLTAPEFYERFAGMLVAVLAVMILTMMLAVAASFRRFPMFSLPSLRFPADTLCEDVRRNVYLDGTHWLQPDYPRNATNLSGRRRAVADARRVAGLLHRGEPILRTLAILTAAALVPLAVPFWGELIDGGNPFNLFTRATDTGELSVPGFWPAWSAFSGWALGLFALVCVGWVVTNAVTSTERPLGLAWDIICFFPGAGHPFGPPCYGERAVPEITKRVGRHLQEHGDDARVVLSAHSMGATIAVAAIFALHGASEKANAAETPGVDNPSADHKPSIAAQVALLTHGVQLRAYFSRFFPEVFGARVLGIRGSFGPQLLAKDPWQKQVKHEYGTTLAVAPENDPPTLVSLLGGSPGDSSKPPRWRSLWRRTDPLGFPVNGYWNLDKNGVESNPIDRGATERSPRSYLWQVAKHDDYLSTLQYAEARTELVGMFRQDIPEPEPGGQAPAALSRMATHPGAA